ALHCALSHFARREHRKKHRWDLACDLAINPLLIKDGLKPPPGALYLDQFEGLTAEEIYPSIADMEEETETLDQHLYDNEDSQGKRDDSQGKRDAGQGGSPPRRTGEGRGTEAEADPDRGGAPQPKPLSDSEREQLSVQWRQR